MTDRPDTQQDLELTLATIQEQIASAADPALLTEGARVRLDEMYIAAEKQGDEPTCLAIQKAWDDISQLAVDTVRAREAALTTMDINKTVTSQRDSALKELEELSHAVEYMDTDHPLVSDLVESVEEAINEQESYWIDDSVAESVAEHLAEAFGYDKEACEKLDVFTDIFWGNIEIQPNRKREFFAWLDAVKADTEIADEDSDDDGDE